jgi:hypothetical protein
MASELVTGRSQACEAVILQNSRHCIPLAPARFAASNKERLASGEREGFEPLAARSVEISPASWESKKSNDLARNRLAFLCKQSVAVRTGSH